MPTRRRSAWPASIRATEGRSKASGIPFTILRNGWYTENYTGSIAGALAGGAFMGSAGAGKISSATRADYADAAVAVLTGSGHEGQTYELAGDEAYTLADLAAEISRQTGKDHPLQGPARGGLRRGAGGLRAARRVWRRPSPAGTSAPHRAPCSTTVASSRG